MRWAPFIALLLTAGTARAERFVERMLDQMDDAAIDMRLGLRAATLDLLDLRLEPRRAGAQFRLGSDTALCVRGQVTWRDGGARVSSRLQLSRADGLSVAIPDFYLVPRIVDGKNVLELRLPLIEGRF